MVASIGETEKKLLAESLQERLIGSKNSVLYLDLLKERIPTFLKNYLQNSVKRLVYTEEPIQFKNSKRFDFDHPKIKQLRSSLNQAFEEVAIFHRDELIQAINKTVSLQFDLLVRPKKTLTKIFYRNKSDQIKSEMLQMLQGLQDGRVYLNEVYSRLQEFDQFHVVETDFTKLLSETESDVYHKNFVEVFISEVKSFMQFLGMIRGYNGHEIKIDLVKLLLEARNFHGLQRAFEQYQSETIDLPSLERLLTSFLEEQKNLAVDNGGDEIDNFLMYTSSQPLTETERVTIVNGQTELSGNSGVNGFEETVLVTQKKKVKIIDSGDSANWIIDRNKIEQQPEGPLEPLQKLIDEKSRKMIVKKIFDQDCSAYENFIEKLNEIDNWKKAKEVIEIELHRRHIMPFSKEALRLGDLAFTRYFHEKTM